MWKRWFVFLILFFGYSEAVTLVRVTPVSYYQGQWYVLLAHSGHHKHWTDFVSRHFPCEPSAKAAQRVLRSETCGFYNLNLASYPWCERCNPNTGNKEIVYFVPVEYSSITKLKRHACAATRDDFAWIPTDQIVDTPCDAPRHISWGFVQLFQEVWPGIKKDYSSYPDWKLFNQYTEYPLVRDAPTLQCSNISWYCIPCALSFFRKGTAYYEFTPNYPATFRLEGRTWVSVNEYMKEHPGADTYEYTYYLTEATRAKFQQNYRLRNLLLCTSSDILVFDNRGSARNDEYLSGGKRGFGKNILGQILMQVRYEMVHSHAPQGKFVEQPLANFVNGKYFTPRELLSGHPCTK